MARGQANNYFEMMVELVGFSGQAARMLEDVLAHYEAGKLMGCMEDMHRIEHTADEAKHELMRKLAREFITPIEREDIMQLTQAIDDVTDAIEDVLINLYMFNVLSVRQEALAFSELVAKCVASLDGAMREFHNFKKSATLQEKIIEVNRLEEEGDRLYTATIRALYVSDHNPVSVMAWNKIYDCLENCCDLCEDIADLVEGVMMKNS